MLKGRNQAFGKNISRHQSFSISSHLTKFLYLICSSQITSKFYAVFLASITMIRRIFSTFIDFPSSSNQHLDFFQPNTSANPSHRHSWPVENLSFLFEVAPCFPVSARNIRIISEPKDFYESILQNAIAAKYRISMASLYLGIGKLETDLVNAIQQNLSENRELKVNILLDYSRGTRGKKNSKGMLMPLVKQNSNCQLSLYHTPMLRGITKRLAPARYNELIGLQHMKIYLFDEKVIISGANLSNDYFTNRQVNNNEIHFLYL